MKSIQKFLDDKQSIGAWLDQMDIKNYTITDDLIVNVDGDLYIDTLELEYLPVRFGEVRGDVNLSHLNNYTNQEAGVLKSLQGCPQAITGDFDCSQNSITSLIGGPLKVGHSYNCDNNSLTSLQGSPKKISAFFSCAYNRLITLVGGPERVKEYYYCENNNLTSLDGIAHVGNGINAMNNKLISLKGVQETINGEFFVANNFLTNLADGPRVVNEVYDCRKNAINTLGGWPDFVGDEFFCSGNPEILKFNLEYRKHLHGDDVLNCTMQEVKAIWERWQLNQKIMPSMNKAGASLLNKI